MLLCDLVPVSALVALTSRGGVESCVHPHSPMACVHIRRDSCTDLLRRLTAKTNVCSVGVWVAGCLVDACGLMRQAASVHTSSMRVGWSTCLAIHTTSRHGIISRQCRWRRQPYSSTPHYSPSHSSCRKQTTVWNFSEVESHYWSRVRVLMSLAFLMIHRILKYHDT